MKLRAKAICAPPALALLLALAGCNAPGGQPASLAPIAVPEASVGGAQSEDGLLSEDEVANHVPSNPLAGAPEFLTREQQQLYLDAYELYAANFGPTTGGGMKRPGAGAETRLVNGYLYQKATGDYAAWDDFWAALTALFTEAYARQLTAPAGGIPVFLNIDGDTWFLSAERDSWPEWTGEDTFLEGETAGAGGIIEFYVVGHYKRAQTGEPYEESYPLTLEQTAGGWRFSQFHLTY